LAVARIFQAASFAFLFVPIQTLAYANLPKGKSNNAAALINLMRNLGGSVGISVATTLLARRSQLHQDRLVSTLSPTSLAAHGYLQSLASRFQSYGSDSAAAMHKAVHLLGQAIDTQAAVLAYLDIFVVLMYGCLIAAILTLFLKRIPLDKASAH
jgi:DHA2 family multidrug resistance protein